MNIEVGSKVLVTTDNWFYAPDGRQYRAAFGTVKAILSSEETLRVKTNAKSTNWYVEIGDLTVAGCQIHYVVRTDKCKLDIGKSYRVSEGGESIEFTTPSDIYDADAFDKKES